MNFPSVTRFFFTGRPLRVRALGALFGLVLAGAAPAATFTVLNVADNGPGSLRQAILDANGSPGADTMAFAPAAVGTIVLLSPLPAIVEDLDIAGPGSAVLTVSGNNAFRVFDFSAGVTAMISGLTIANGRALSGGGINHPGGTLTVSNSVLADNDALSSGGAIENRGMLTLTHSALTGNHAGFSGGGIQNSAGQLTITNSLLSGNTADFQGGGILNTLGLGSLPEGRLTVADSTLSGNAAGSLGGGGIANGGTATMHRSTLVGNTAGAGGGGIDSVGTLVISNSTLSGNRAGDSGGAVLNRAFTGAAATVTISFSTLANNTAAAGGGLFNGSSTSRVTIKNSLVASNGGGDCGNPGGGLFTSLGINQATDGSCPGFISVAPALLALGPLAANGGPTPTHALLAGSLAIDAAPDCLDAAANAVVDDQRGAARPSGGPACDVGAFEFGSNGSDGLLAIPALGPGGLASLALLLAAAAFVVLRGKRAA